MTGGLKRTHFHAFHAGRAELGEFAGFEMPLWYEGIIPEHMAVREAVGLFDVSHMGRISVEGPDAEALLDLVLTNDISGLEVGRSLYSPMCDGEGGMVDDVVVLRLSEERFLLVVNAANRSKDLAWLNKHAEGHEVAVEDLSDRMAMMALQGPKALEVLQPLCDKALSGLKWHAFLEAEVAGAKALVARMGYTGEDGFEIYLPGVPLEEPDEALRVWDALLEAGKGFGIKPCGLGARDTLRLEAGYPLYGADLNEETTPLEAGLDFAVKLDKGPFIGRDALLKQAEEGPKRRLSCLKLVGKGIPRPGYPVLGPDGREVGRITSGTFSPILRLGIAMAYLPADLARPGAELTVVIRGRGVPAVVVEPPFYDPDKYGRKRKARGSSG